MGYPSAHGFCHRVLPLSVNYYDQHWWIVHPAPMDVEVETTPVAIQTELKRITHGYVDSPNYRKRMLLYHVLAVSEAGICDPVRVQARGRPTGSPRQLPSQYE